MKPTDCCGARVVSSMENRCEQPMVSHLAAVALVCVVLTGIAGEGHAGPVPGEQTVYQCDFDENMGPEFVVDPYEQGATLSGGKPHSGTYCLSCRGNTEYYQYFGLVKSLRLKPGRTYRLSLWSRISDKPLTIVHVFFHKDGTMPSPPRSASLKPKPCMTACRRPSRPTGGKSERLWAARTACRLGSRPT